MWKFLHQFLGRKIGHLIGNVCFPRAKCARANSIQGGGGDVGVKSSQSSQRKGLENLDQVQEAKAAN